MRVVAAPPWVSWDEKNRENIAHIDRGSQKEGKDPLNSTFPRGRYLRERSITILPPSVTVNDIVSRKFLETHALQAVRAMRSIHSYILGDSLTSAIENLISRPRPCRTSGSSEGRPRLSSTLLKRPSSQRDDLSGPYPTLPGLTLPAVPAAVRRELV